MSAAENAEHFYQCRPKDEARGHRGQAKSFTNVSKSSIFFHPADSSKGGKVYKFPFEPLSRCGCWLLGLFERSKRSGTEGLKDEIPSVGLAFKITIFFNIQKMSLAKRQKFDNSL